jgi:4-amino-4-deoxy-L-arabinose transferase-like glycosyltransferase
MSSETHRRDQLTLQRRAIRDQLFSLGAGAARRPLVLLGIFLLALGIRLWGLYSYDVIRERPYYQAYAAFPSSPLMEGDALVYSGVGARLVEEGTLGVPFHPPLTSLLMAGVFAVFGESFHAAKVVLCLLSALTAVLLVLLGGALFSWRVGVVAGLLTALSFTQVIIATGTGAEAVQGFLLVAFLLGVVRLNQPFRWWKAVLLGLLALAAQLNRSEFLILFLVGGVWYLAGSRGQARQALLRWSAVTLVFALGIGIWAARNAIFIQEFNLTQPTELPRFVPFTLNGGVNFFIGNNPAAHGGFSRESIGGGQHLIPGNPRHTRIVLEGFGLGWAWLREHPGEWAELLPRKAIRFWRVLRYGYGRGNLGDTLDGVMEPGEPLAGWDYGLFWVHLAALLLGTANLAWQRGRSVLLPWLVLAAATGVAMVFFGMTRAALPYYPLLALLMAGVVQGWQLPWRPSLPGTLRFGLLVGLVAALLLVDLWSHGASIMLRRTPFPDRQTFRIEEYRPGPRGQAPVLRPQPSWEVRRPGQVIFSVPPRHTRTSRPGRPSSTSYTRMNTRSANATIRGASGLR